MFGFAELGSTCFSFDSKKGRVDVKRFYAVPAEFFDEQTQLVSFARRSIAAAETKAASKKRPTAEAKQAKPAKRRSKS